MKKALLALLISVLGIGAVSAQTDSTVYYNKLLAKSIIKNQDGSTSHQWNLNLLSLSSAQTSSKPGLWSTEWNAGPDLIYLASSQLNSKNVQLNPASSWEWGFSLLNFNSYNYKRTFGYKLGILLSRTSYRLDGDDAIHVDDNGMTVLDNALQGQMGVNRDKYYKQQRLIYWSWRIPLTLDFKPTRNFGFSLGAEAELRHHVRSRAKVGHDTKYYIARKKMAVDPLSYNALLTLHLGNDISIVGRYSLKELFDNEKTNLKAQPFMIGLSWDL